MSHKNKGCNAERELIHLFWNNNWAALRAAGSGSNKYPCPDIIASNRNRMIGVECKTSKKSFVYLHKEEVSALESFCLLFGGEPWIGVRFDRKPWFFIPTSDLKDVGAYFKVDLDETRSKYVLFEELIMI